MQRPAVPSYAPGNPTPPPYTPQSTPAIAPSSRTIGGVHRNEPSKETRVAIGIGFLFLITVLILQAITLHKVL